MGELRIGAAALNQTPLSWNNNQENIEKAVAEAEKNGIQLLCLPELTITGYGCQDMFLSPWVANKAWSQLIKLESFSKNYAVCFTVGLPVFYQQVLYNGVAMIQSGQILGVSLKQNLPDDGIYYEPRWFKVWPGGKQETGILGENVSSEWQRKVPLGEVIYSIESHRVAFEICEDAWRQNRPAISLKKRGIDIVLNPSASHFEFNKADYREELMRNSSEKFDCVYVYSNQLGNESGRTIYEGDLVIASKGKLLARAEILSLQQVQMIHCNVDIHGTPKAIEPEKKTLSKEKQFLDATTLALHDYLRKSGSKCFVISLSGGADSATCAVLVAEMVKRSIKELGPSVFSERIGRPDLLEVPPERWTEKLLICAYQSTENSSETTLHAASELAKALGATFYHWSIQDQLEAGLGKVEQAIGRKLSWATDDIALQNIQARLRAPLVWVLANIYSGLLITTSNRSEGDVGYTTMDGDTAGSIAPLAGIDKVFIREWLHWAESHLGISALKWVNEQQPTAELRPSDQSQTDEEDLMPYPVMLQIEREFLIGKKGPNSIKEYLISTGIEEERAAQYIDRFFTLWSRNQWKRERLAPSFHLDDFNIDPKTWMRFPIINGGLNEDSEKV